MGEPDEHTAAVQLTHGSCDRVPEKPRSVDSLQPTTPDKDGSRNAIHSRSAAHTGIQGTPVTPPAGSGYDPSPARDCVLQHGCRPASQHCSLLPPPRLVAPQPRSKLHASQLQNSPQGHYHSAKPLPYAPSATWDWVSDVYNCGACPILQHLSQQSPRISSMASFSLRMALLLIVLVGGRFHRDVGKLTRK